MIYRGREIPKFQQGEGKYVPNHVIADYYKSEKRLIDKLIERELSKCSMTETVEEGLDYFFDYIEGENNDN